MNLGQLIVKGFISNFHIHSRIPQRSYLHDDIKHHCMPRKTQSIKDVLIKDLQPSVEGKNKITIVGAGDFGIACAYTLICQNLTNHLCLIDINEDRVVGETLDMKHGASFKDNLYIEASTDYAATKNSKLCIIAAGFRQHEGESRLALAQQNTEVIKTIIPPLVKYSPDAVILMATNPVDILTHVATQISGLPKGRVLGAGTNVDSSRFRFILAKRLGVSPDCCYGWIIGEHGDSSVAVWSGVYIAGIKFTDLRPLAGTLEDPENWNEIHQKVIAGAYDIIGMKGHTSWGGALSIASLTNAILNNVGTINAVSLPIKGYYGIKEDICLSLPAVLGKNGITDVVRSRLTDQEIKGLHNSVECIAHIQAKCCNS